MKKRTIFLVVFVLAVLLATAACGRNREPEGTGQQQQQQQQQQQTVDPTPTGPVLTYGQLDSRTRAEILADIAALPRPTGQVTWASTTHPDANIGLWGWSNPSPNNEARSLMHGPDTVFVGFDGSMNLNPMVVRDFKSVDNPDGSRTLTITIYDDLLWSDGNKITARDYLFTYLLLVSPAFRETGASSSQGFRLVGFRDYTDGNTPNFAGLRLVDEFTFSKTVDASHLPFFFEVLFASVYPLPMHVIAPGVTMSDSSQGVSFCDNFTFELLQESVNNPDTGYRYNPKVFGGAYVFHSFDEAGNILILEANPNFVGTADGYKPRIQRIIMREVQQAVMIDTLAVGEIDLSTGVRGGTMINPGLDLVDSQGRHHYVQYARDGYGMIRMHGDIGPTQFAAVRQAVILCIDRDDFARQFTGGHGILVHGPYALSQWMYRENMDALYDRIDTWDFNPQRAEQILIADGWVYNADGGPYVAGPGLVRHKRVDGELMPLVIEWLASTGNVVSDLIAIFLPPVAVEIGMQVNETRVANVLPAAARSGEHADNPFYQMFNMGTGFGVPFQPWLMSTTNPAFFGTQNPNFFGDEELYRYATAMRLTTPGDNETYAKHWLDWVERWNYLLPDLPLYADLDYDFVSNSIGNWNNNSTWHFRNAIVRAYIR
jgi:peptide/nickel transport system substrate-binding protein